MESSSADRETRFEKAFEPFKEKVAEAQKGLNPILDLKKFMRQGYLLLRKTELESAFGAEKVQALIDNQTNFISGMKNWLNQDYEIKKTFKAQVSDYLDEVKLWCPGYWDKADFTNLDRYQKGRDEALVFPQETYESRDVLTNPLDECLRPHSATADTLDVSALPNVEGGSMCLFADENLEKPLVDACMKVFGLESVGPRSLQIASNYYREFSKPLRSHCDAGFVTTGLGPNHDIEVLSAVSGEWERPNLEDGDVLVFTAVQFQKVFGIEEEYFIPPTPHRVMHYDNGRFSTIVNHFYRLMTA